MKTFQEFITEARGKFRGHRTPEEIDQIRKERAERKAIETQDTPTNKRIRDAAQEAAFKQIKQKNQLKGTLFTRMRLYQGRPSGLRNTTLDTVQNIATLIKKFSRDRNKLKRQKEDRGQLLPSQHPDANFSSSQAAERADRLHRRRRNARSKLGMPSRQEHKANQRAAEQESRKRDQQFRRDKLKKTVGQIPGQLGNR